MKYPLTEKAKEGAKLLLKKWDEGKLDQLTVWTPGPNDSGIDIVGLSRSRILEDAGYPLAGVLHELSRFGLIDVKSYFKTDGKGSRIEILLLQELRNAVESDFEVSEFFLTMNAVGSIITGGLHIEPGGLFMSGASNTASLSQSVETMADNLAETLGRDLLESQNALRIAIDELREATEAEKPSKVANVITQLGNSLGHGANTVTISSALIMLARYL